MRLIDMMSVEPYGLAPYGASFFFLSPRGNKHVLQYNITIFQEDCFCYGIENAEYGHNFNSRCIVRATR